MKRLMLTIAVPVTLGSLSACSVVPPLVPIERKTSAAAQSARVIQLPLSEVITRYAPPSFKFDPNADVDYGAVIDYDTTLPWGMAFNKALAGAGIDPVQLNTPVINEAPSPAVSTVPSLQIAQTGAIVMPPRVADAIPQIVKTAPSEPPRAHAVSSANAAAVEPALPAYRQCDTAAGVVPGGALWEALTNNSLKQTLETWSGKAGWEVEWSYRDEQTGDISDLTLGGGKKCIGSYSEAVRALIDSLAEQEHVRAQLVPDNNPPLLRVFNLGKDAL